MLFHTLFSSCILPCDDADDPCRRRTMKIVAMPIAAPTTNTITTMPPTTPPSTPLFELLLVLVSAWLSRCTCVLASISGQHECASPFAVPLYDPHDAHTLLSIRPSEQLSKLSSYANLNNKRLSIVDVNSDVEKLRSSENRFRALIQQSKQGVTSSPA